MEHAMIIHYAYLPDYQSFSKRSQAEKDIYKKGNYNVVTFLETRYKRVTA
jgi:hypothetical protein